jgi:N-acetylneuraminate lyase
MKNTRLTGLIAAPFTPFDSDFRLRLDVVPRLAAHLVQQNVRGAFIGGTTGEWASLTLDERYRLAAAWRAVAGPDLKVIVHVGHNCLADCRELARQAEEIGADAIAALMPSFFRPATVGLAVDFCRRIAEVAPKTPFYYYHMPDMTGVDIDMHGFLPEAIRAIPTFRGIKFTHSNVMDYGLTVEAAGGSYDILFGRDEFLLAGLALGAKGAVGSTYNYSAPLYNNLIAAHSSGNVDGAKAQQVRIQRVIIAILKYGGGVAVGKAVMSLIGIDCGPPRPPLERLAGSKLAGLKAELDALDFFAEANNPPVSAFSSARERNKTVA